MISDLKGKVALITGASTGIGAAAAHAMASHGVKVVVHYNASVSEAERVAGDIKAAGGEAALVRGDVMQSASVKQIVAGALAAFGRIDILINNAGGIVQRMPIEAYSDAYLDDVIALNVKQVAWFIREIVPVMRKQGGGNIINVSSIAAKIGGGGNSVIYAGAKGFISTATRGWARELAGDRIRVNAVSPGVITTPFHAGHTSDEQLRKMQASIPMKRLGAPDDCAGTFVYLASDEMSGYVTGEIIEVNGGM
jgi:3-oxoacyl-[acyl-carrier protein] reductase